jgi:hypothetical protein
MENEIQTGGNSKTQVPSISESFGTWQLLLGTFKQ